MPRQPSVWFRDSNQTYYTTIDGKQISLGKNESKAKLKFDALIEARDNGTIARVDVLLNEFLDDVEQNRSAATYESYRDFLKSFSRSIPNLRVADLKPDHVRRWLNSQKQWSDTTKGIAIRTIKRAFNWAHEQGLVTANPVALLKAPRTHARDTLISPDDWAKLIAEVPDEHFKDFLTILRETGCRPAEARKVTGKDLRGDCWVAVEPVMRKAAHEMLRDTGRGRDAALLDAAVSESAYSTDPPERWLKFLNQILPAETISFVQRLIGSALVGEVREHLLPILYGVGGNGKGVLVQTIGGMLGDYATTASESLLLATSSHPTEVADLFGKRFVAINETDEKAILSEARVKNLTGGDVIVARRMREDPWSFLPSHTPILSTNYRPTIKGTDNGI